MRGCLFSTRILAWLVMLVVVFCIGCESPVSTETPAQAVKPGTAEPETRAVEEKAEAIAEAVKKIAETETKAVREKAEAVAKAAKEIADAEAKAAREKAEVEAESAEKKAQIVEPKAPALVVSPAPQHVQPPPPETAPITQPSDVVVIVSGIDITQGEIEAKIKPRLDRIGAQSAKIPPAFVQRLKRQAVESMIVELLLDEKVKEADIAVTEEDVIAHLVESGSKQQPPLSLEDIKELIKARGQSFEETKENIRKGLTYQKFMETRWADEINVTEEDAEKYYSENKRFFKTPEQVRVSHILIKPDTSDPNTDPNEAKAAAVAKTQDLLEQIKDGADFAELAKSNSACPSAAQGGDVGLRSRGAWVKPFEEAAFKLEVGQVSDVVETRFGYHIIKVIEHQDPNTTTFEQARDDIREMLTQRKQGEFAKRYVESLKASANIVYLDPTLQKDSKKKAPPSRKEPKTRKAVLSPPKAAAKSLKVVAEPKDKTEQTPASSEAAAKPKDNSVE